MVWKIVRILELCLLSLRIYFQFPKVFHMLLFLVQCFCFVPRGGHWPRKRVWGCAALKTPFSRLSCRSQGSHFKQKSQFTRPLLRKSGNFSLNSLNFHPNFSSQAPKFGNFQLTSPQIWKFSAHKPPFSEANVSSQAPHFGNPGRTPLPEKKLSAPPPPGFCSPPLHSYFYCQ